MNQFGIVARIALIVTVALVLGQLAVVFTYVRQNDRSQPPPFAIANRIVSVVRLIDDMPVELRPEALAVASVTGFKVSIAERIPPSFEDDLSVTRMRVITQSMIDEYVPGRFVRAGRLEPAAARSSGAILTFLTELKTGEVAIFNVSDDTTLRIWSLPIGFVAGFFGVAVALLAIFAVAREARPLVRLAQSIDTLGNRAEPVKVKEHGARELRSLIRAINAMQERIFGLVNNRTVFLGAISHDLKTYLTRFRLRLEMMPHGAHRDKAIRDVEAMEQLLGDALLFASDTAAHPEAETVDFSETVGRCAREAEAAGMSVSVAALPEGVPVRIPQTALCRVIDNLVSNAVRYGERARIAVERRGAFVCLVVEDDGPGIDPQNLGLVFEPFFRGEPSRNRAHGGTGLGLSIVKQIVDAYGGTIALANIEGRRGLRATLNLPLARGEDGQDLVTDRNRSE